MKDFNTTLKTKKQKSKKKHLILNMTFTNKFKTLNQETLKQI